MTFFPTNNVHLVTVTEQLKLVGKWSVWQKVIELAGKPSIHPPRPHPWLPSSMNGRTDAEPWSVEQPAKRKFMKKSKNVTSLWDFTLNCNPIKKSQKVFRVGLKSSNYSIRFLKTFIIYIIKRYGFVFSDILLQDLTDHFLLDFVWSRACRFYNCI